MSLLLDALNRASKDKEKAGAAAASAAAPAGAPVETPVAASAIPPTGPMANTFPELTLAPAEPTLTPAQPPGALQLNSEPALRLEPNGQPPHGKPDGLPALEFTLEAVPEPSYKPEPSTAQGPVLELHIEAPTVEPAPEPPAPAALGEKPAVTGPPPTPTQPTDIPEPSPLPLPSANIAPAPETKPVFVDAAKPPTSEPLTLAALPKADAPAKPGWTERIAQDMRRAHAQPGGDRSKRRRWMALGGLAIGFALAIGTFSMGWLGDPAVLLGLSRPSLMVPAQPPAEPEPAAAAATIEAAPLAAAQSAPAPQAAPPLAAAALSGMATPPTSTAPLARSLPANQTASTEQEVARPGAPERGSVVPTTVESPSSPAIARAPTAATLRLKGAAPSPVFSARAAGPSALERGYSALLAGNLDEASAAYAQALQANPDERDALLGQGYISHQRGQLEEAQANYRKVLRQDPSNVVARSGLMALDAGGDTTLTAGRARELAARQPDSAAALAMAGNAFVRDGLLSEAARAYGRAQAIEPGNAVHAYNHAVALDRLGQFEQALMQYDKVLSLSATVATDARVFSLATVRQRRDQLQQAITSRAPTAP